MSDILNAVENMDLTNVETDFPVLEQGICDFTIANMQAETSKNGNGTNIIVELKTAMPYKTRKGEVKQPGFPLRDSIYIPNDTTSEKGATAMRMSQQKLAQLKLSVFGTQEGAFGKFEQYVGKTVSARLKIESDEQFGDRNRVAAYVRRNG